MIIMEVSLKTQLENQTLIMKYLLLDGVRRMGKSFGKLGTHGEPTGVKRDSFELSEVKITFLLKMIVFGLYLNKTGTNDSQQML